MEHGHVLSACKGRKGCQEPPHQDKIFGVSWHPALLFFGGRLEIQHPRDSLYSILTRYHILPRHLPTVRATCVLSKLRPQFSPALVRHATDLRAEFLGSALDRLKETISVVSSSSGTSRPSDSDSLPPGQVIKRCFGILKVWCDVVCLCPLNVPLERGSSH